ncbi:MAG TPA: hypothetical protein VGC81_05015 [Candidatus Methylomirabilis sp.]|jgi:type II secretory pathway pseudopilin PulG
MKRVVMIGMLAVLGVLVMILLIGLLAPQEIKEKVRQQQLQVEAEREAMWLAKTQARLDELEREYVYAWKQRMICQWKDNYFLAGAWDGRREQITEAIFQIHSQHQHLRLPHLKPPEFTERDRRELRCENPLR